MWFRAILAFVALTYIVCVLVLNGLQKEDLDVSTLRKLQRHNVNIDDVNNEALRKECETVAKNSSTKQNADENKSSTLKTVTSGIDDKHEEKNIKLSDSNLQNIIINYFNNVQKTNKPNNGDKDKSDETKPNTDSSNVEHFMNVWKMLSRTMEDDVEYTTKAIEHSKVFIPETTKSSMRSNEKNMEYINKILENFITNNKITSTSRPITSTSRTTKSVDYGVIARKIQEMLANTGIQNNQNVFSTQSTVVEDKFGTNKVNENIETLRNNSIRYIDDIMKLTNHFKMFGPVSDKQSITRNINFEDTNVQYQTNPPAYKNHINKQMKSLSEDFIREISESVKAKVLQDLKKEMTTSTTINKTAQTTKYTTAKTTTVKQTEKTTTKHEPKKEKMDTTEVLEKFMEMFQRFKGIKEINEPPTKHKSTEDNTRNANNAQVKIVHLPTENIPYIKPLPVNITSVIINPYNPIHTAILPNEPYALLNINSPIQNIPMAKPAHKITQLNIFNTRNNFHTSPITIQTNENEVPPLGLPAPQSVVYQNIVVSTKHPFEKVKHDYHQSYITHERNRDNKYKNRPPPTQTRVRYDEFGIDRHDRSREFINEEYSREINRHKPNKYKDYSRSHYGDHNIERFHEKLERADDWPRISKSREITNIDDDYSTPKLITRHQLPLNGAKTRTRYDDAHFRNFLKTQQKVNDMLERILATKTIAHGPRSVETTV